jgi:prenyl protein peptidase
MAGSPELCSRACNCFFFSVQALFVKHTLQDPITEELVFRACVLSVYHLSGASIKRIIFLTPSSFGASANETISFSIIILTPLLTAHIHHFWDMFNRYGKTRDACDDRTLMMMFASVFYSVIYFHQSNRSHRCPIRLHDGLWISLCLPFPTDKFHLPAHIFCNMMGIPQLGIELSQFPQRRVGLSFLSSYRDTADECMYSASSYSLVVDVCTK